MLGAHADYLSVDPSPAIVRLLPRARGRSFRLDSRLMVQMHAFERSASPYASEVCSLEGAHLAGGALACAYQLPLAVRPMSARTAVGRCRRRG